MNPWIKLALQVVVILSATFILLRVLKKISSKEEKLYFRFICNALRIGVITIATVSLVGLVLDLGNVMQGLLTGGGLVLAVLTFAAQKILNNTLSGLDITASKPFEIGQKIKVLQGSSVVAEGLVKDITLRHTIVDTFDGQSCIIPNGVLSDSVIINTNFTEQVGNFLEVEVGYNDDIDLAIQVVIDTVEADPRVTNHSQPLVSRYLAEGVLIKTTVWTKTLSDNFAACGNIRKELLKNFKANGISIPYQTVTIDLPGEEKTVPVPPSSAQEEQEMAETV
ncbi:MAG: mechanosensitive ion channel family protein [Oscillospiraceae bacterium]|nr:mechanosensitive ion channel family protein [Oscillospiraceae bacterium]